MTPDRVDTLVVGAGPAGTAAAITLARAGREVVVLDKAARGRNKCCGDGLTTGALRLLEGLGLHPGSVQSWQRVQEVLLVSPAGRRSVLPLPENAGQYAAVARRADLDAALFDLAQEVGADVRPSTKVTSASSLADGCLVTTEDGSEFHASHLIAADGMWSPTRRMLGVAREGYRGEWHAFRQYFTGATGPAATQLAVSFEADLLPGYFWAFPLGGGVVNVGFGIQRGGQVEVGDMAQLWADLLAREHLATLIGENAEPESPHRAWPIPAAVDQASLSHRRCLFVGDAATATDPMTGEGIGQALQTGITAGRSIIDATQPDEVGSSYETAVRKQLLADHRMADTLSHILADTRGCEVAIAAASSTGWTRRNFARWLFEDYPRAVALTARRWRRGVLSGPGAFSSVDPLAKN